MAFTGGSVEGTKDAVAPGGADASNISSQVNQFPPFDSNGSGNVGSDGVNGPITNLRQAVFVTCVIGGPSRSVVVGGLTTVSTQEGYDGFDLVSTLGTFRLEPRLGTRKFTGTITRYQPRGNSLKSLVRAAYAIPQGSDIRLDMLPVQIAINYVQVGANYNYNAPFDKASWLYGEAYFHQLGSTFNNGQFVDETVQLMGQAEIFSEGSISLITQPQPKGMWAKLP